MWKMIGAGSIATIAFGTSAYGEPAAGLCKAGIVELSEAVIFRGEDIILQRQVLIESDADFLEAKDLAEYMNSEMFGRGDYETIKANRFSGIFSFPSLT